MICRCTLTLSSWTPAAPYGLDAIHSYPVDVRDGQLFLTAPAT